MSIQNRNDFSGRVGFAIGTGRCGTEFIARVAGLEPDVAASHERNPFNESFHRYCQWYGLPVDGEGFLVQAESEIRQDLMTRSFSFESSAYLSLSVRELWQRLGAKFVLLVRSPERVVNSFHRKGWYSAPIHRADPQLAPGFQENESFHHTLARFMPSGEKFLQWNRLSRIGKLAWYWNALNERSIEMLSAIPQDYWRVEKIEELDYERYLDTARFLGFEPVVNRDAYETLVETKPNRFSGVRTVESWSAQEIAEFEAEVEPMARRLGYEHRVERMEVPEEAPAPAEEKAGWRERLRSSLVKG